MSRSRDESTEEPDRFGDTPHPRVTDTLLGQEAAEQVLLSAYRSGRMPHAWLLAGREGIGKATLAYRVARFVLAHPDPSDPAVVSATTLAVVPEHPVSRLLAAGSHPDLASVRRTLRTDGKKLAGDIRVEDVRRATHLFESTASAGGWRIVIVDSADEMNRHVANALLKTLEEPPSRALFLLVSHAPGQLLPTTRSRCRRLDLRPLSKPAILSLLQALTTADVPPADMEEAACGADGSLHRALESLDPSALTLRRKVRAVLDRLPALDQRQLHDLMLTVEGRGGEAAFTAIRRAAEDFMLASLRAKSTRNPPHIVALAEVWARAAEQAAEAEAFNLDRRPVVLNLFRGIANAVANEHAA